MARVRRNWTVAEDELLRRAVRTAEDEQRPLLWRELAKAVPGRSNKDCRRRWWNSLSEGNAKGPWTEEEDERLTAAVQRNGTNWALVSRDVKSRSSDQCSSHWSHVLDPNINYCDWDEREDSDLLHQVHTYGTKWAYIASIHTPIRTTLALKNRFSTLRLKSENKNRPRQGSSSTETSWSRANSADTAMTSPHNNCWSPVVDNNKAHHVSSWSTASSTNDSSAKFNDEFDGVNNTEEDDLDEDTNNTSRDLPAWSPRHHHHQLLRVDTNNLPFIQASFANWDARARLNDAAPSDGTSATSHISPILEGGSAALSAGIQMSPESYFSLESPLLLGRLSSSQQRTTTSALPNYCFIGGEENNKKSITTIHPQESLYPLCDDIDTCQQFSPTELAKTPGLSNNTTTETDALAFGANNIPSSSDLDVDGWTATTPTTTTTPYRVSFTMTCHPGQLANVMSQMSTYESGVTFNFADQWCGHEGLGKHRG